MLPADVVGNVSLVLSFGQTLINSLVLRMFVMVALNGKEKPMKMMPDSVIVCIWFNLATEDKIRQMPDYVFWHGLRLRKSEGWTKTNEGIYRVSYRREPSLDRVEEAYLG